MDPVNPWLDPSEVRHLAEQLLRPVSPARLAAADPGFDTTFVGFTDPERQSMETLAPVEEVETPPVLAISEIAQYELVPIQPFPETIPQFPDPEPTQQAFTPPPQPSPETRFQQRIEIFRSWLSSSFQATDIFILNEKGDVLFDEGDHGRLHFMARNLVLSSSSPENIHVKIGPESVLEVIPCETAFGRIVLGALVPAPIPAASVRTITEVLIQTASPG